MGDSSYPVGRGGDIWCLPLNLQGQRCLGQPTHASIPPLDPHSLSSEGERWYPLVLEPSFLMMRPTPKQIGEPKQRCEPRSCTKKCCRGTWWSPEVARKTLLHPALSASDSGLTQGPFLRLNFSLTNLSNQICLIF